jgi:hypothetical protein
VELLVKAHQIVTSKNHLFFSTRQQIDLFVYRAIIIAILGLDNAGKDF